MPEYPPRAGHCSAFAEVNSSDLRSDRTQGERYSNATVQMRTPGHRQVKLPACHGASRWSQVLNLAVSVPESRYLPSCHTASGTSPSHPGANTPWRTGGLCRAARGSSLSRDRQAHSLFK